MLRPLSAPLLGRFTHLKRTVALDIRNLGGRGTGQKKLAEKRAIAPYTLQHQLCFSSAATVTPPPPESSSSSTNDSTDKNTKDGKKDDSNIFLDNLGKIFLGAIGMVIATLVRSSYGTSNRNKVRDDLEERAALDPLEIDDLRVANSELTPQVFRAIRKDLDSAFPEGRATYTAFVRCVRGTMRELKGDAFTIELGHLMDRVVLEALRKRGKSEKDEVSLVFFLAALSLALHSSVPDRVQILFEAMRQETGSDVRVRNVIDMVGYLQDTCQLVPAAQVIESATKYPTQQYQCGTPRDLVQWDGSYMDTVDVDAFSDILHCKSVCAWGECHNKRNKI